MQLRLHICIASVQCKHKSSEVVILVTLSGIGAVQMVLLWVSIAADGFIAHRHPSQAMSGSGT